MSDAIREQANAWWTEAIVAERAAQMERFRAAIATAKAAHYEREAEDLRSSANSLRNIIGLQSLTKGENA